jgi:hypothetical protein
MKAISDLEFERSRLNGKLKALCQKYCQNSLKSIALSKILSKQSKYCETVFFQNGKKPFYCWLHKSQYPRMNGGKNLTFFGLFSHHLQSFSTLPAPLLSSRKKSLQKLRPEENRKLIPGKRIQDFFCLFFKSHFSRSRTDAINIRQIINLCPVLLQCRISL